MRLPVLPLPTTLLVSVLVSVLVSGLTSCGTDASESSSGRPRTVAGEDVLRWGDGDHGVVLAHGAAFDAASWEDQATAIAETGATVLAVEDISPESILAAVESLRREGLADVALVGASAGADAILRLAAEMPDLPDQLVLISPNTVVEGLGDEPQLFIASEDEPGADVPQELVEANPGSGAEVLLVPGSAHAQNIFDTEQADRVLDAVLTRVAGP